MANSNIPATANQSLTSNTLSSVGRFAKIAGVGLIFGGLPAAMSIGTLLGATGTGLGLASQATSSQSLSLARAF